MQLDTPPTSPEPLKLRILTIDDDVDQRDLTREVLEDRFGKGTVSEAGTGREALAYDLSSFTLILSDYNLPDCTGLDLLSDIRACCMTPVIMVTGENVSEIAAESIRRGASDYVVKTGEYIFTLPLVVEKNLTLIKLTAENDRLRRDLENALEHVQKTNKQLEVSLSQVQELAATDPLTRLYNRRHFAKVLDQMFSEASRYGDDLTCVMVDLDSYKQLNDSLGHQVGDDILMLVGDIFRETMRKADVAARYGGDEFVLLLPHCDAEEASRLAERVRSIYAVRTAAMLSRDRGMTMSVGVASMRGNQPSSADDLVSRADAALYESKEAGRNRVTVCADRKSRLAV